VLVAAGALIGLVIGRLTKRGEVDYPD
jgi:hypothetical protein